ncbi:MAG: hypothetical protein VX466_13520 [Myxococcota bacterium]|nr:hypothetical protein [Myxococcota bacterium]
MTDAEPKPRRHAILVKPFLATAKALEAIVRDERRIHWGFAVGSVIAAWYVYVPIHELLHALGCWATGGSVTILEIQTQYGGAILAEVFPFVRAGGEYAGRLSGFDTHGSDLVYLATDALPYVLSIVLGVPLLRACGRASRPLLFGPAIVLGLAPFYNLPGDYYEMGSIVVTRIFGEPWDNLRSDDFFDVMQGLWQTPEAVFVGCSSLLLGIALAYATWDAGDRLARAWVGPPDTADGNSH